MPLPANSTILQFLQIYNAPTYQVLRKLANPGPSYSDFSISNQEAVAILDLILSGFQPLHGLQGPTKHSFTKFQRNRKNLRQTTFPRKEVPFGGEDNG